MRNLLIYAVHVAQINLENCNKFSKCLQLVRNCLYIQITVHNHSRIRSVSYNHIYKLTLDQMLPENLIF